MLFYQIFVSILGKRCSNFKPIVSAKLDLILKLILFPTEKKDFFLSQEQILLNKFCPENLYMIEQKKKNCGHI